MIKTVMFFRNGNAAVCDEHGQQVTTQQEPWLLVYLKYLGVDPVGVDIRMPDGKQAEVFVTDEGFNWRLK